MREFPVASHHLILQPILHLRSPHRSNHPYSVLKSFSYSSSKFTALETCPAKWLMLAPTVLWSTAALTQCAVEDTCFYKGTCGAVSTEWPAERTSCILAHRWAGQALEASVDRWCPNFFEHFLCWDSHWTFNHRPFLSPSGLHTIERKMNSSMHLHHE